MKTIYGQRVQRVESCALQEKIGVIDTPAKTAQLLQEYSRRSLEFDGEKENAIVICLNARFKVLGIFHVSKGTVDTVIFHPRDVFRPAIASNAVAVIIAHNHPTGNTDPSEPDIRVTRDMINAGRIVRIEVLDHLIFSENNYCSLREKGYFYV